MVAILYSIFTFLTALVSIINIVAWILYIVIVSYIVKYVYTDENPTKLKPYTAAVVGTMIGATFNYVLDISDTMFALSGIGLAVVGTIVFIKLYERRTKNVV